MRCKDGLPRPRGGMQWLTWSVLTAIWAFLDGVLILYPSIFGPLTIRSILVWPVAAVVTILFVAGVMRQTCPRPGGLDAVEGSGFDSRFTARLCACITIGLAWVTMVLSLVAPPDDPITSVICFLALASLLAFVFALVVHLKRIAEWLGFDQLAHYLGLERRELLYVTAVAAVSAAISVTGVDQAVIMLVTEAAAVVLSAGSVVLVVLLMEFRRQLREAADGIDG